jgi:hypothetical protein
LDGGSGTRIPLCKIVVTIEIDIVLTAHPLDNRLNVQVTLKHQYSLLALSSLEY